METMVLKACREYQMFKFDHVNRPVTQAHTERLAEMADKIFMLDLYPIVTTPERVIVDGQHRYTMAKEMRIPFYSITSDGVSIDDIAVCNSATNKYTKGDSLHVYARLGIEPYERLKILDNIRPEIGPGFLANWASSSHDAGEFSAGEYFIDQEEYAFSVVEAISDYAKHNKRILSSISYKNVIAELILNPLYDHKKMLGRLEYVPGRLILDGKKENVIKTINGIYNYRINDHNRVDLTKSAPLRPRSGEKISSSFSAPRRGIVQSDCLKILKTSDLQQFTIHPSARPIRSLNRLILSIKHKNLLHCFPIIVDRNMTVFDGQHRLAAAKKLGLPIYYIVSQSVNMWMVAQAGGISKNWSMQDHLHYHIEMGSPEYIKIQNFIKRHSFIQLRTILRLEGNKKSNDMFKMGTLTVDWGRLEKLTSILMQIESDSLRKHQYFQRAMIVLLNNYQQSDVLARAVAVINREPEAFFEIEEHHGYTKVIESLYNYGISTHKKIQIGQQFE